MSGYFKKGDFMEDINLKQLTMAVRAIAEEKDLSEEAVMDVIEQAIAAAWRRDNAQRDQNVVAKLNTNNGTAKVKLLFNVVEEVENLNTEMTLEEAKELDENAEIGGVVGEEYEVTSFGRVAAQTAKQVVMQRLREAEREAQLASFEDKVGTLVTGVVARADARLVRIELGKASGIIPASEQISGERLTVGSRVKVYIKVIERDNRGPQMILSRASEKFVQELFTQEVPEIDTGSVEIRAIAREAGLRTKIAVYSSVQGVDPVGTFVGSRGTRVNAVMHEIGDNEKIDIISYDEDVVKFIEKALSPAEVLSVAINESEKKASVYVTEDQQSIAIGRGGQNVRLAGVLTGYDLDIVVKKAEETAPKQRKNVEDSLFNAIEEGDAK